LTRGATGIELPLGAVSGTSADDVWAVGSGGTILHYDGTNWRPSSSGATGTLFALWAEDRKNAWAVGDHGTIVHWDGARWTPSPFGSEDDLHGIWAPIGRDIWVVGFSKTSGKTSTWRRKH